MLTSANLRMSNQLGGWGGFRCTSGERGQDLRRAGQTAMPVGGENILVLKGFTFDAYQMGPELAKLEDMVAGTF